MKLRHLQLLIFTALLAFPVHAQVTLDSAEVARILQGKPLKEATTEEERPVENDEEVIEAAEVGFDEGEE